MTVKKIAQNVNGDDLLKVLGPVAHRVASADWDVFADQGQFGRLVGSKGGGSLRTYSLLRPSIFDGFKRTVVASACFEDTMFYRLFMAKGVSFNPVKGLNRHLRYQEHENGGLITIYYAGEEPWSKRYRDKSAENADGGQAKVLDQIKGAVLDLFKGEPFAWMGNKDVPATFFPDHAERLPNTPHGLNSYQHLHGVVVLSALNPPPAHFGFMEAHGIDGDQVRTAHYRTAVYQAVMRCSIRNPLDTTPKRIVVMDHDTADWLAALFPGAQVEPLPGLGLLPRKGKQGRKRLHASNAEKAKAHRDSEKRKLLAQVDLINGTSLVVGRYPFLARHVREEMREFTRDENTSLRSDSVTPHTSGSLFGSIYDNEPDHVDYEDDASFIAALRDLHGRVVAKEDAGVFSPAHFDPDKAAATSRGLDNVTHLRGIWLDNDGGDLTPEAFAGFFPYLRIVVWNTASHTPEKPRWRAFIPTTLALSIDVHALIMRQIERVLNGAGFWGKLQLDKRTGLKNPRRHGFDESKFNAASLFYLPCQARNPADSFFKDSGEDAPERGPLDIIEWIENCILPLLPEPEPVPVTMASENIRQTKPPLFPEMMAAAQSSKAAELRSALITLKADAGVNRREAAVSKAVETWRSTPPGMGHVGFFKLGAAFKAAGLDDGEIRVRLHQEAVYAHSPAERRREIKEIMKSLSRRGRLK
ncbi:hypothetical protein [Alsobacter sp. SYSU BS001988]